MYLKKLINGTWRLLRDGIIIKSFRDEALIDKWLMFYESLPANVNEIPNEKLALAIQIKVCIKEEDANLTVLFAEELASVILKENERRNK